MNEIIAKMMNKEVIIYIGSGSTVIEGTIESVNESWISLKTKSDQTEAISIDYISRIKEYPLNKKGKKKMIAT